MRILGLDVGDKTIGVAVSDALQITAQALEVIRRTSLARDIERLRQIIMEHEVSTVVVGLPKNMNGTVGPRGELAQRFAHCLAATFPELQIAFWDERLSTVASEKLLVAADVSRAKRKQVIDKMAAAIILQGFLDAQKRR
ncbi:MAG: Holliday junction resolvase RuvX [Negativicutes bacterium]|nr:Holliday junction resolvase RuvX [Negativicutes bacterium]